MKPKAPKKRDPKPSAKSGEVVKKHKGLPVFEVTDIENITITLWFKRRD